MGTGFGYAGATALTVGSYVVAKKTWSSEATRALIAGLALVILAGMADRTPAAPIVRAIGLVLLLAAALRAIPKFNTKKL